ncbi:Syntaxin, partial [Operophtera brumata]
RDYGATTSVPAVGFADFSPTELYNLSEGIADNINTINSGLKAHDTQQKVNSSVSAVARDIQRLGAVVRRGDKPHKLQQVSEKMAAHMPRAKRIEADVLDVNQIIQELSTMVNEQSQTVESVESHIEAASANVEAGVDELAKAAEYQRRYRRKMFIFSMIGIVLLILLIVWIVKAFK